MGLTPLDIELLTLDQIAIMCLSRDAIKGGRRVVSLTPTEAAGLGITSKKKPGEPQSKAQRIRAKHAERLKAEAAKAKAERQERRRLRRAEKNKRKG